MITIDTRTQKNQPQFYPAFVGAFSRENVQIELMRFGDIAFTSRHEYGGQIRTVGIEHSTLSDFLGKIDSGRLAFQMAGMREMYDVSIMMVEGTISRDKTTRNLILWDSNRQYDWERWSGVRFSLEMHGIKFFTENNRTESIRRVISWYRWWQKPPSDHKLLQSREAELSHDSVSPTESQEFMPDFSVSPGSPIDRVTTAIADLVPQMGTRGAEAALRKYHSLSILSVLPEDALRQIEGWGPVLAKRFHEATTKMHYLNGE